MRKIGGDSDDATGRDLVLFDYLAFLDCSRSMPFEANE